MTEKVKVSKKVADAIHTAEEFVSTEHTHVLEPDYSFLVIEKIQQEWVVLGLSPEECLIAIRAFLVGYEIEETPEEKLLKKFKIASEWTEAPTNEPYFNGYQKGVRDSILGTLDILGIKIKGIND